MQEASVLLMLIAFLVTLMSPASSGLSISLPECPDKCGNVSIPYPFGIGTGCAATSLNRYFTIICNDTFQPPQPMVDDPSTPREVIDISLEHGEMCLYGPVSYNCFTSNTTMSDNYTSGYSLESTPYLPSPTRNRFIVIGCNTLGFIGGYMHSNPDLYVAGCYSYCQGINSTTHGAPCTGMGCCETTISPNLTDFAAVFVINQSSVWNFNPCFYAMLAEVGWYSFRQQDLVGHLGFINDRAKRGVPDSILLVHLHEVVFPAFDDLKHLNQSFCRPECFCCCGHGLDMLVGYEIGCCLEVDVPMLVYEFISNSTLFEFLHGNDRRSPIPLDLRLKIATQSAEALAYIHSSTSRTIFYLDVPPEQAP